MLKKQNRITAEEFKQLGRPVRSIHTPFFSVKIHTLLGARGKFTVVASKKVSAIAPARNRMRRRLYDLLREYATQATANVAIVVYLKETAARASFQELKDAFRVVYGAP